MQIEAGKYYRMRNGQIAGPAEKNGFNEAVAFTVPHINTGHPATYWACGARIAPDCEQGEDLIEEVKGFEGLG